MSRLRGRLLALAVAVLVLAGCTSPTGRDRAGGAATPAPSGPSCISPPSAPATAAPATAAPGASASGEPLPDLTLPCFVGGQPVRLAHLGTPAVVNLWASWCGPCRAELPEIQRYAERAAGRVQVIGVITSDPVRSRPQSVIDDFGLRFPMLYDEQAALRTRAGAPGMPTTLLIDAHGRVAYRYSARPLTEAALADLVDRHLGVKV
jgi:thiol-disulfide isomerase/thioredoxin